MNEIAVYAVISLVIAVLVSCAYCKMVSAIYASQDEAPAGRLYLEAIVVGGAPVALTLLVFLLYYSKDSSRFPTMATVAIAVLVLVTCYSHWQVTDERSTATAIVMAFPALALGFGFCELFLRNNIDLEKKLETLADVRHWLGTLVVGVGIFVATSYLIVVLCSTLGRPRVIEEATDGSPTFDGRPIVSWTGHQLTLGELETANSWGDWSQVNDLARSFMDRPLGKILVAPNLEEAKARAKDMRGNPAVLRELEADLFAFRQMREGSTPEKLFGTSITLPKLSEAYRAARIGIGETP